MRAETKQSKAKRHMVLASIRNNYPDQKFHFIRINVKEYVFSNSDVKNVAISGAYSAGKSSVLASYKKKHGELRFLHISLAHFKSTDQESDAEVKESTLEGKILNQLIHQIPSEKIPQTNFRVKKTVSSKSIATSTIGAVLFLISILHLLFFSVWKNYIWRQAAKTV